MTIVTMMEHREPMFLHPNSNNRLDFEIAGVSMSLYSFQAWKEEKSFLPFVKKTDVPNYQIVFRLTENLPELSDEIIHEDECYRVHPDEKGGYIRSFFDAPRDFTPYAVAEYDHTNGRIQIECLAKGRHCVSEIHNSFFHIGFEAMLIHKERLCIHASCIKTDLGGILFCGPSGIGKSTQADLWCKHRDAIMINGDRPILSKSMEGWFAWGSPYAGSSKCHVNDSSKVTAIVILEQAEECTIKKLTISEAFRAVWSGLTVHSWDKKFVEEAINLNMELVKTIPVYKFSCIPDEPAVKYLEKELGKDCCHEQTENQQ